MTARYRLFGLLLLLLWGFFPARAQNNYPVLVTPTVKSVYSLRWQDYATNPDLLRVNILLRDQTKDQIEVYLYVTIKGLGWSIQTRPDFVPMRKLRLERGSPQQLTGLDLAEYFAANNVLVQGLPPELIRQGGTFPEGFCTLEVYAHEGFRDRQVSNTGHYDFAVFALKPPILISPAQQRTLYPNTPQRVLFQWAPQTPIARLSGQSPFYRLQVWEAGQQEPDAVALSNSDRVWTKDVAFPSAVMDNSANLTLEVGKTYAWRVTLLQEGFDSPISNAGRSEVWSFRWGGECLPPEGVQLRDLGGGAYRAQWQPMSGSSGYRLHYRAQGTPDWTVVTTPGESWSLSGPLPFEIKVAAVCGNAESQPSAVVKPSGAPKKEPKAEVVVESSQASLAEVLNPSRLIQLDEEGNVVSLPPPDMIQMAAYLNSLPLPKCAGQIDQDASCDTLTTTPTYSGEPQTSLSIGDVLVINRFKVYVTAIEPNGDRFSGQGLATWPFLGQAFLLPVELQNLRVVKSEANERGGCVVEGQALSGVQGILEADALARTQTLYAFLNQPTYFTGNLDLAMKALVQKSKRLIEKYAANTPADSLREDLKYYKQYATASYRQLRDWQQTIAKQVASPPPPLAAEILAKIEAEAERIEASLPKPTAEQLTANLPLPEQLTAWKEQLQAFLLPNRSQLTHMDFTKGRVNFSKSPGHGYGFDAYDPSRGSIEADYPYLKEQYKVPYLSLRAQAPGTVLATLETYTFSDTSFRAERIFFYDKNGQKLDATYAEASRQWEVQLPAGAAGSDEVFAQFQAPGGQVRSVGQLLVERWEEKTQKLQLIDLTNTNLPADLAAQLSAIYKPALVGWEVLPPRRFSYALSNNVLQLGDHRPLSSYSAEMKALMAAYFGGNKVDDPEVFYLFIVPAFSDGSVQGYMPRGRNVGFVTTPTARLIAHELGHGLAGLRHIQDEQPASTQNLMDYGSGTYLTHAQWERIQHPPLVLNWFDSEEEGQLAALPPDFTDSPDTGDFTSLTRTDLSTCQSACSTLSNPGVFPYCTCDRGSDYELRYYGTPYGNERYYWRHTQASRTTWIMQEQILNLPHYYYYQLPQQQWRDFYPQQGLSSAEALAEASSRFVLYFGGAMLTGGMATEYELASLAFEGFIEALEGVSTAEQAEDVVQQLTTETINNTFRNIILGKIAVLGLGYSVQFYETGRKALHQTWKASGKNVSLWKSKLKEAATAYKQQYITPRTSPPQKPTSEQVVRVVKGTVEVIRGISKSDFIGTVGDFADGANTQIAEQAWDLWKQQKWSDIENLFKTNNINRYNDLVFPPNNGAINIVKKTLDPSDFNGNLVIDRYGSTTGKFTAPANTPFGQRALPASYASQVPQKYKVVKPIQNVEEGQIIPWFNQPGLGTQYKLEQSVQYYIDEGYLQIIP